MNYTMRKAVHLYLTQLSKNFLKNLTPTDRNTLENINLTPLKLVLAQS